jgi:hypothetical protein
VKPSKWQYRFAAALLALSVVLYAMRWLLFPGDALHNEMVRFLVGDVAFVFVQVLLVTLFIDRIIRAREREETLRKLNMVIGAFFSQTGAALLGQLARADARLPEVHAQFVPKGSWRAEDYARARAALRDHTAEIDLTACDLARLRDSLAEQRSFMISLLANEALLEHESFSDLLWALTHLGEELALRPGLADLEPADARHIAGDVKRAYTLLGAEWLSYMRHLQEAYPFLFSLAVRTNPLDPAARVVVTE